MSHIAQHDIENVVDVFSEMEGHESETRERRGRFRQPYLASVELTGQDESGIAGSLKDIAADSCFVFLDTTRRKTLAEGGDVSVSISVMRGKSSMVIGCPGRVVRKADDGVAVVFDEPLCWWPIFSLFPVNDQFIMDVVRQTV